MSFSLGGLSLFSRTLEMDIPAGPAAVVPAGVFTGFSSAAFSGFLAAAFFFSAFSFSEALDGAAAAAVGAALSALSPAELSDFSTGLFSFSGTVEVSFLGSASRSLRRFIKASSVSEEPLFDHQ